MQRPARGGSTADPRRILVLGIVLLAGGGLIGCDGDSARAAGSRIEPPNLVIDLDPAEAARLAEEARSTTIATIAPGFELNLWAPEVLVADPIGLSVDHLGRVVYTRSTRSNRGEFDIRGHRDWMVESITFETVADRRAFLHRVLAPDLSDENDWLEDYNGDGSRDWRDLTFHKEEVYRIEDTSGDGLADRATLLIADFNEEDTDVANGVLAYGNDVYVSVAPDLWRLRDTNGDGVLDTKESISHGYGVHIGFSGHGMSGITVGPDGRIYWGIGDIGLNVTDQTGRQWAYPHQGAIMRAEPDGSGFEVFAAGLRNTHEFVFDEFGNLISVDNDGDHPGERERIVYVVEGSDSGWRINWQFGKYEEPINNTYKVWMEEGLSLPRFEGQAAYILPPIASYQAGPAGMVYNPGTALSPEWRNHFFVSAFTGSPANTRIHAFTLEESGAGFSLARDTVVLRGVLTTGMDFGPDGALYLADWITGWGLKDAGRIWKFDTPSSSGSAIREETRQLLATDFSSRPEQDLARLLRHDDMRIRTRAQFELADRGDAEQLLAAARQREHRLARVHGLWGIGQISRHQPARAEALLEFLRDEDAEIRAQAAKLLGDVRHRPAGTALMSLLTDGSPRARLFAAEALGRIEHGEAFEPLVRMLAANDDEDVYLRHAGSLALARVGAAGEIAALSDHSSRAVRMAAVVALRRQKNPLVARFLDDVDEYVVTEAARAINDDESIEGALPDLARLLDQDRFSSEPIVRRVISANLRLGTPETAARLARFAERAGAPEPMRVDALLALSVLPRPSVLDRVDGSPRGAVQRDPAIARNALAPTFASLIMDPAEPLRVAAARAAARLEMPGVSALLAGRLLDDPSPAVRAAALEAIGATGSESLETVVRTALADPDPSVRMTALRLVPDLGLSEGVTTDLLLSVVGTGAIQEQQAAVRSLGELHTTSATAVLDGLLDRLAGGRLPPEVELELFEAVDSAGSTSLRDRLGEVRSLRSRVSPLAEFSEALHGGDRQRGQQVVMRNESAQCTRCHTFADAPGGPSVGPDLRGIGALLSREQLLESLVAPDARIPPGYAPPSAMPAMQHLLTRSQLRDVVEYLTTLR